jgi:hypothetical protein
MRLIVSFALSLAILSPIASAHHAGAAIYDPKAMTQIEGEVTRVFWRNPHVRIVVMVVEPDSKETEWRIKSNSVSILSRMGVTLDVIGVGDRVRIAGWPARRKANGMFATNMLLPNGKEVLLAPRAVARWSDETLGTAEAWVTDGGVANARNTADGIFRVWSTNMANPDSFPLFKDVIVVEDNYPLTDEARKARESWDPVADNPYLNCTPMGMPRVMGQPYPIEFVDKGNEILLRIELFDIERTIWLTTSADMDEAPTSSLGQSVGQWQDGTLVVTTTNVDWPYFDQSGVPLSEAARIVEHFTPSNNGGRLEYRITVTDPETFTEPVSLEKYWAWRPGEVIQKFECSEFEGP